MLLNTGNWVNHGLFRLSITNYAPFINVTIEIMIK